MLAEYFMAFLKTLGVPTEIMIGRTHIMKQNGYSAITDLCGLARTPNLAGCLEQAPAEGVAPMLAYGEAQANPLKRRQEAHPTLGGG